MKFTMIAFLLLALSSSLLLASNVDAELIPSADGLTVYDTLLKVRWLANANLPGTPEGRFGVANITPNGSMDYATALEWVAALNSLHGGGYLMHNNWTLPTTPTYDPSCSATGPHENSFGFGCKKSAMGSLYYRSLRLRYPDTAVRIPYNRVGPFINFQPYLYWTDTSSESHGNKNGYHTFSFNTGWAGSNVDGHYMYVLPMIEGKLPGRYYPTSINGLQVSADRQTVYDPSSDVTWLADADLAKSHTFHAQCINTDGTLCINPDGSMTHTTALSWIDGMNAYNRGGWLGQTNWKLPPYRGACDKFGCTDTPLGELYYNRLGLSQGTPVVPTPDVHVSPFNHLQPYLYWSCDAALPPASPTTCGDNPPAEGFEWSFSFGNGFQGTDVKKNDLYVMVYFPETPAEALTAAIEAALETNPLLNAFLSQAEAIISAPNPIAKARRLWAFIIQVNAQRGKALTAAQADELIDLAEAV